MPASFLRCVAMGGKVRTISGPNKRFGLKAGEYVRICFPKSGPAVLGEKKKKEKGE